MMREELGFNASLPRVFVRFLVAFLAFGEKDASPLSKSDSLSDTTVVDRRRFVMVQYYSINKPDFASNPMSLSQVPILLNWERQLLRSQWFYQQN